MCMTWIKRLLRRKRKKVNFSKKYFNALLSLSAFKTPNPKSICRSRGPQDSSNSYPNHKEYFIKIWPVMTSRMCSQWQSFIWSLIGPTGFCSFPGSMSRLGCQNGHLNIEMRHTTEFPEIMQNDSVPIEFIFKKIIFVRRAQRTEFNISSKKMSRQIPYCIRSIHVIRFNVLIVYHPRSSNGLPIDIQLELGSLKILNSNRFRD